MPAKKQELGNGLILFTEAVSSGTPDSTERLDIASGPAILVASYCINADSAAAYLWMADTKTTFAISGTAEDEVEVFKLKLPPSTENNGHNFTPMGLDGDGIRFTNGISFKLSDNASGSGNTNDTVTVSLLIKEFDSAA